MIRRFECYNADEILGILKREEQAPVDVESDVREIIANVVSNGDEALFEYAKKFDKADVTALEVTKEEIEKAVKNTDKEFLLILEQAKANIWNYHEKQKRSGYVITDTPGVVLGQKVTALDRVGVYVPGGTAVYPSTVLMDVIPAKIAGVKEIILVSPPNKSGEINSDILAAAYIAGADRIFKVGGAQAIAALAFGTESIPKVDKIVGPGNTYVATAKSMVFGKVDIDMIAGPSEILIIADDTANPDFVAVDLLSQAEHDKFSASFLVTTSEELADKVAKALEKQLETLPRKDIAGHSISNSGAIIVTDTLSHAAEISNNIAPEHLEICTAEPFSLMSEIRHAGSIFLGNYAPEALGDYYAGPNHTLPTSGTAKFSSGLSVDDFTKKSSFIYYDKKALNEVGVKVSTFAEREGLSAHARSITIRMEENEK